jgi:hypothetical protein
MKAALFALALTAAACAQEAVRLEPGGTWRPIPTPREQADAGFLDGARRLIAQGEHSRAGSMLTKWLEQPDNRTSPWYPEALLLRGNSKVAAGREFAALYDYEEIARDFAGSEVFAAALEKELEVAELYLAGRKKRVLGVRIESGVPFAEEIILRINERLPGSKLAERALRGLADHYYGARDLRTAAETYDVYLSLFPTSPGRGHALQRRVFATLAQYRGPQFDGRGLEDAKFQIEDFQREFPRQARDLGMTDALTARIEESQAEELLITARWYLNRDDLPAARLTLNRLIRKYPATAAAQDAMATCEEHGWLSSAPAASAPVSQPAEVVK